MTVIKALEELKAALESCRRTEMVEKPFDTYWITVDACNAYIEALEAEIAERFIPYPCDADGVPIHVGDRLECHANGYKGDFTVFAIGNDTVVGNHDIKWIKDNPDKWFHVASSCHHFKQRTIEDVLRDYACDFADSNGPDYDEKITRHYADKIRGLLGVDE